MKLFRLFCLGVLTACGTVPLEVINDPVNGAEGAPCAASVDCLPGLFCERTACFEELGTCAVRPTSCEDVMELKCGCDGLTYLNSCYRRLAGNDGDRSEGPCTGPNVKRCTPNQACPNGSFCGRLLMGGPEACMRPPDDAPCAVVPEHCTGGRPEQFFACGAPSQCLDFCAAIRQERPVFRLQGSFCP